MRKKGSLNPGSPVTGHAPFSRRLSFAKARRLLLCPGLWTAWSGTSQPAGIKVDQGGSRWIKVDQGGTHAGPTRNQGRSRQIKADQGRSRQIKVSPSAPGNRWVTLPVGSSWLTAKSANNWVVTADLLFGGFGMMIIGTGCVRPARMNHGIIL